MYSKKILKQIPWRIHSLDLRLGVVLIAFSFLQTVVGDIEPKLIYDDPTVFVTKLDGDSISMSDTMKTDSTKSSLPVADLGFIHAFVASISVILVSELGDKTFFIAAIMAMRHPRLTVFTGAISALGLMTILSAVFGMAATIIPRVYTYYISTALFAIFGLKMLKDGYYMSPTDAQEELEEVQSDLRKREDELLKSMKDEDSIGSSSRMGSSHSVRIRLGSDADEDNDDQTRSMLSATTGSSTAKVAGLDTSRRSQSVCNFNSQSVIIDGSASSLNSNTNCRYPIDAMNGTSTTGAVIINGDINANGMELTQIGSKKRLEREVSATLVQDPESGVVRKNTKRSAAYLASRIFMQAFTMTFLAEWGDRSQLTTIILSAREDVYGVIVGGILGHSLCTGLAVIGGRIIAQKISVRTVTIVGGVVFLIFAISALFFNPNEE